MSQQQVEVTAVDLAESSRLTQVALKAELVTVVAQLWPELNFSSLEKSWPSWLARMTAILADYHARSSDAGALLYRATRQLETGDPGTAVLADPPSAEWMTKALGYSAPGVFEIRTRAGDQPDQAARSALATTLGTTSRIALDGGRATLVNSAAKDPQRVRYYRVTDGDPCYFCALSASRGAVFRSEASAGATANARLEGPGQFKFHDNCGCSIGVAFGAKPPLTGIASQAASIYSASAADLPNADRLNAFRAAWNARHQTATAAAA